MRRLRGQVDTVRAGARRRGELLRPAPAHSAARGAINGLVAEVLEEHVTEYLSPVDIEADARQADAAEELIEIIHSDLTDPRAAVPRQVFQ